MRKLLFRIGLIAILIASLMDITDKNAKNYGTQIASSIGNIKIDIPEVIGKIPEAMDKAEAFIVPLTERLLEEFGFVEENKEESITHD